MTEIVSIERDGAPRGARSALERCIADGGVAVFPADGLYGLACDPLDPAAIERIHRIKGRDDGKPSAVLYFSPLAMRELVDEPRPAHPRRGRRAAAGPGDPRRRQPRAPLPARLPRGPGAARRPPDRRPAGGRRCARSSRPRPTSAASRRRRASRTCRSAIVAGADLAIDGGALTGLPSTVVDIASIDVDGDLDDPARGRVCRRERVDGGRSAEPGLSSAGGPGGRGGGRSGRERLSCSFPRRGGSAGRPASRRRSSRAGR